MSALTKLVFYANILSVISFVGLIVLRYPSNHGGGIDSIRWIFGVLFLSEFIIFLFSRNRIDAAGALLALAMFAFTFWAESRNIMIHYDTWIERGMPRWGERLETDNN